MITMEALLDNTFILLVYVVVFCGLLVVCELVAIAVDKLLGRDKDSWTI